MAAKTEAKLRNPPWRTRKLTAKRLKEVVSYDPNTGQFTRLARAGVRAGIDGGNIHPTNGYHYIRIDGRRYMAHQIAWLYMTGSFPATGYIDHRDGNRSNNRFSNLRPASYAQNQQNRPAKSNNIAGLRGVSWHPASRKFVARIMVKGATHHLGYFKDPNEAHQAYLSAKQRLHEFQPVPRDLV